MAMVRQGYQPVYRPRSYSFGALQATGGEMMQAVDIVDADGALWTAVYTLAQQADGTWRITSCSLVKKPSVGA